MTSEALKANIEKTLAEADRRDFDYVEFGELPPMDVVRSFWHEAVFVVFCQKREGLFGFLRKRNAFWLVRHLGHARKVIKEHNLKNPQILTTWVETDT